jgi:hypothetical protein
MEEKLMCMGLLSPNRTALSHFHKLEMQHDKKRKRSMLILFGKS